MSNATSLLGFVQGVNNELMFGWLGTMVLIGISIIAFMAFMASTNDSSKAMVATTFLAFGFAVMLRSMSLIPNLVLYITLIMTAGTLALIWKASR